LDQGHFDSKPIVIKSGSWIGASVTILPGVTVGKNSVIGSGSVLTKSIPDFVIAAGNPAIIIRSLVVT
jgi:acetyltransferase-like isoleucine patch superfamily enzyme